MCTRISNSIFTPWTSHSEVHTMNSRASRRPCICVCVTFSQFCDEIFASSEVEFRSANFGTENQSKSKEFTLQSNSRRQRASQSLMAYLLWVRSISVALLSLFREKLLAWAWMPTNSELRKTRTALLQNSINSNFLKFSFKRFSRMKIQKLFFCSIRTIHVQEHLLITKKWSDE